jgi:hypothetical protein
MEREHHIHEHFSMGDEIGASDNPPRRPKMEKLRICIIP